MWCQHFPKDVNIRVLQTFYGDIYHEETMQGFQHSCNLCFTVIFMNFCKYPYNIDMASKTNYFFKKDSCYLYLIGRLQRKGDRKISAINP